MITKTEVDRRGGFFPKLRPGEKINEIPGLEPTRLDGKIVYVSAKGDDEYAGGSAYTYKQLEDLLILRRAFNSSVEDIKLSRDGSADYSIRVQEEKIEPALGHVIFEAGRSEGRGY